MKVAHFLGTIKPEHDGVTRVMYQMMPHHSADIDYQYISPILPKSPAENMHSVSSISFPFSTDYKLAMVNKKGISKIFGPHKPDIVHIHTPCPLGWAAMSYAVSNKIPYVITFHTHFPSYLKHYGAGFLEPLIWKYLLRLQKNCSATIVPSTAILAELKAKGFKNLVFIPHGVNTNEYSPKHKDPQWKKKVGAENKTVLLFVSRLVEEKNLKTLSKIPKDLKNNDKVKFVIVGDGPARKKLEELMPDAHFTGYLFGQELLTAYASSDLFVFPSMTETFGNVTAEALASGLPCVCANKGAAGDLIKNGENGFLVSGLDSKEYAETIDLLVENPLMIKKMSDHCVRTIENLSWQGITKKYENLYKTMVQTLPTHDASHAKL